MPSFPNVRHRALDSFKSQVGDGEWAGAQSPVGNHCREGEASSRAMGTPRWKAEHGVFYEVKEALGSPGQVGMSQDFQDVGPLPGHCVFHLMTHSHFNNCRGFEVIK